MRATRPAVVRWWHIAVSVWSVGLIGCSGQATAPKPTTGVVSGTISSSLGGGIAGAVVILTPTGGSPLAADTTEADGTYRVPNVPKGPGSVVVSFLPGNCSTPKPAAYTITPPDSAVVDVTVSCIAMGG